MNTFSLISVSHYHGGYSWGPFAHALPEARVQSHLLDQTLMMTRGRGLVSSPLLCCVWACFIRLVAGNVIATRPSVARQNTEIIHNKDPTLPLAFSISRKGCRFFGNPKPLIQRVLASPIDGLIKGFREGPEDGPKMALVTLNLWTSFD